MRGGDDASYADSSYADFETDKKDSVPFRYRIIKGEDNKDDDLDFLGSHLIKYVGEIPSQNTVFDNYTKYTTDTELHNKVFEKKDDKYRGTVYSLEGPQSFDIGSIICSGVDGEQWPKKVEITDNVEKINDCEIIKQQGDGKWGWARTIENISTVRTARLCNETFKTKNYTFEKDIDFCISRKGINDKSKWWPVKCDIFYKSYRTEKVPRSVNKNDVINNAIEANIKQLVERYVTLTSLLDKEKSKKRFLQDKTHIDHLTKMINHNERLQQKLKLDKENIDDISNIDLHNINKELYIYNIPTPEEEKQLDFDIKIRLIEKRGIDKKEVINAELIKRLKAQGIYNHQSE